MVNHKSETVNQKSQKTLLAVGPTLHYSHRNVQFYWLLAAFMFSLACLFWSRIVTGTFWSFDFNAETIPDFRDLGQATVTGVSIFEYPWQILVLGLLMGILAVVPVLVAQLMSFGHSFLFVLAVFFLANLPGFAVFLVVSCFGAAIRPLRFRSRIIAIALCMAPHLVYWGIFGGARGVEPLAWGFSFAPWIWAWLTGMTVAGLVLAIGHYTRYKPGLIWTFTTTTLLLALILFQWQIGFDELDYQLYVARNNPEEVAEFRDHSIREALDKTIADPKEKEYRRFFYPTEVIPLRQELKKEIQGSLARDNRWPARLIVPEALQYETKRQWLNEQYDRFLYPPRGRWTPAAVHQRIVERRARSKRRAIALYYKALLNEYTPDLRRIEQDEMLHFCSDYPHRLVSHIWFELYRTPRTSPEAAEARWRAAKLLAGQKEFQKARAVLAEAEALAEEQLALWQKTGSVPSDSLFSAFRRPPDTVMTPTRLRELQGRIHELQTLIGDENLAADDGDGTPNAKSRVGDPEPKHHESRLGTQAALAHLAAFVMCNPYGLEYESQLAGLLTQTGENDALRDNLLLAQAKLIADDQRRAERLGELSRQYQNTDGGLQALYELTRLNIRLYQREPKRANLMLARDMLSSFLDLYPNSFYAPQVKKNLDDLPRPE